MKPNIVAHQTWQCWASLRLVQSIALFFYCILLLAGCSQQANQNSWFNWSHGLSSCSGLIEKITDGAVLDSGEYKSDLSKERAMIEKCRNTSTPGDIFVAEMFLANASGNHKEVRRIAEILCPPANYPSEKFELCYIEYRWKIYHALSSSTDKIRKKGNYIIFDIGHSLFPEDNHMQMLWVTQMAVFSPKRSMDEIYLNKVILDHSAIMQICMKNYEFEYDANTCAKHLEQDMRAWMKRNVIPANAN